MINIFLNKQAYSLLGVRNVREVMEITTILFRCVRVKIRMNVGFLDAEYIGVFSLINAAMVEKIYSQT